MKTFVLQAIALVTILPNVNAKTFNQGLADGKQDVTNIFNYNGGCSNIYRLQGDVDNELIYGKYRDTTRTSPSDKLYNEGGRAGANDQVAVYEQQCLSDPSQCLELGTSAAQSIAYQYCQYYSAKYQTDYVATCREIAINDCKGKIYNEVYSVCQIRLDSNTLLTLQNQCQQTIDNLIGPGADAVYLRGN